MKVFKMDVYMVLPDDFTGGVDEALELWKARRDDPSGPPLSPEARKEAVSLRMGWEPFYLNSRYGYTTLSEAGIWYNGRRGWYRLDRNPESVYSGENAVWAK